MPTPDKNEKVEYKWTDRCFTRDDLIHAWIAGRDSNNRNTVYKEFDHWFKIYLKRLNNA